MIAYHHEIMPLVYEAIKAVPNEELQHNLLIELLALLQDEEVIKMIEAMIAQDEWVFDSPFLRRIRQEEAARGHEAQRQSILYMVVLQYDPSVTQHQNLQELLDTITDNRKFMAICEAIIRAQDFIEFYAKVREIAESEQVTLMAFA